MIFDNFKIHAEPFFTDVTCKKCRNHCKTVPNSMFSKVFLCTRCEIVYELKLVKMRDSNIDKDVLKELLEKYKSE